MQQIIQNSFKRKAKIHLCYILSGTYSRGNYYPPVDIKSDAAHRTAFPDWGFNILCPVKSAVDAAIYSLPDHNRRKIFELCRAFPLDTSDDIYIFRCLFRDLRIIYLKGRKGAVKQLL